MFVQIKPELYSVCDGGVCFVAGGAENVPVRILHDTGASKSFILESTLTFSTALSLGKSVLIQGIALTCMSVLQLKVVLQSELVNGETIMGVCLSLPVGGVDVILGKNLAGRACGQMCLCYFAVYGQSGRCYCGGIFKCFSIMCCDSVFKQKQLMSWCRESSRRLLCRSPVIMLFLVFLFSPLFPVQS